MEIVYLVILRIRNLRSVNNSLKWSDFWTGDETGGKSPVPSPICDSTGRKSPVPSPPRPFPKVWLCSGISFRPFQSQTQAPDPNYDQIKRMLNNCLGETQRISLTIRLLYRPCCSAAPNKIWDVHITWMMYSMEGDNAACFFTPDPDS